jgi:hypothetical protein
MKPNASRDRVAECVSISGLTIPTPPPAADLDPQSRNAHAFRYAEEPNPMRETLTRSGSTGPDVAGVADPGSAPSPAPSRLWLWFVAAFLLQCAAWITWFVIASHHRVEEVPLERSLVFFFSPNSSPQSARSSDTEDTETNQSVSILSRTIIPHGSPRTPHRPVGLLLPLCRRSVPSVFPALFSAPSFPA